MAGIYAIVNNVDRKVYVGSSVNLLGRKSAHISNLKAGSHHSSYLQNAWRAHGEEVFVFEVLEKVDDLSILIAREQYWMDFFQSGDRAKGYNVCEAAGSRLGTFQSESARKKMSLSSKGKGKTKEHAENIRLGLSGIALTDERKENIRSARVAQFSDPKFLDKHTATMRECHKRHRRLTEAQVREIRKLRSDGAPWKDLSEQFSVVSGALYKIVHRQTYADVA